MARQYQWQYDDDDDNDDDDDDDDDVDDWALLSSLQNLHILYPRGAVG